MLPDVDKAGFTPIEIPRPRRNPWAAVKIVAALVIVGGAAAAWFMGYRPPMLRASTKSALELAEVDRGDVDLYVAETGSIESAVNTTVRCEVEALIGLVGGTQGASGKGGASGSSGQGAGGSASGQGGSGSGADASAAATTKSKTAKKAGTSSSKTGSTTKTSGSTGSTSSSASSSSSGASSSGSSSGAATSGSSSGGASGGSSSSSSSITSTAAVPKPVLRSFSYVVTPYTPTRSTATTKTQDTTSKKSTDMPQQGKGGGGRGKGGGGGFGGAEEKAGSTRIVKIKPEGTRVKAGEIVAELDSSSYVEEERTQRIRYLQAKSSVEQARSVLEVAQITLREYRDGVFPQDLQLLRQYIDSCRIARDRAASNLKWSEDMLAMSFRTQFQVKGDRLALEQTEVALQEGEGMLTRLTKYTAPKLIKSLEANVAAIQADLLNQEASFVLEEQRLRRLQKNIEHCTVKAPGDGVIVYANQADWRGMASVVIDEGVTLREKQPIFNLPDPQHMRVKAKINESKVALVRTGQPVQVIVDAFPDRPLKGVVAEVTPISIPIRGSDVRIYYANIDITEGSDALKPGLSAEVLIQVERRENVARVPIDALRWVSGKPYVAIYQGGGGESGRQSWRWQAIEVGLSDPNFIEIVSGAKPGDRVIAHPSGLPAPAPEKIASVN